MRRLRERDGNKPHYRDARYHMGRLRRFDTPLHNELRKDITACYQALKQAERDREDAEDEVVDLEGAADGAETAVENLLRDFDADLTKLDRTDPALNARKTIFPNGYGAVIDPDGDAQLDALETLRRNAGELKSNAVVAENLAKLDTGEAELEKALDAVDKADEKVDETTAAERGARKAIRQQLEVANGKLRIYYKANPGTAEQFFLRGTSRKKKGGSGEGQ